MEETNTYFIPGYLLGADAALFQALRGREWLKNQKSIFTLGKHGIAILHLLGHKQIRINTNIRLHGKYSTKYNVCVVGGNCVVGFFFFFPAFSRRKGSCSVIVSSP